MYVVYSIPHYVPTHTNTRRHCGWYYQRLAWPPSTETTTDNYNKWMGSFRNKYINKQNAILWMDIGPHHILLRTQSTSNNCTPRGTFVPSCTCRDNNPQLSARAMFNSNSYFIHARSHQKTFVPFFSPKSLLSLHSSITVPNDGPHHKPFNGTVQQWYHKSLSYLGGDSWGNCFVVRNWKHVKEFIILTHFIQLIQVDPFNKLKVFFGIEIIILHILFICLFYIEIK